MVRRWLLMLLAPPRFRVARAIEEALRNDVLPLSRGERKMLTSRVCEALEQLGVIRGKVKD